MSASSVLAAPIMKVKCRFCGKHRHPHEFVHDQVTGYCWHCYEWNTYALNLLETGQFPRECQGCARSYDELERMSTNGDVRFGFHRKDGIYQVLGIACGCSDAYERARLDMYGKTPYGYMKRLAATN